MSWASNSATSKGRPNCERISLPAERAAAMAEASGELGIGEWVMEVVMEANAEVKWLRRRD